jgi:hypothetical protein
MDRLLLLVRTWVFVGVTPAIAAERQSTRPVDLSPPQSAAATTVAPGASLSQHAPPVIEPTVYVGPSLFHGDEARSVQRTLKAVPRPLVKMLVGRVGPWGISSESLGISQWSAGLGLFARF